MFRLLQGSEGRALRFRCESICEEASLFIPFSDELR
jgi:hypothetical protein